MTKKLCCTRGMSHEDWLMARRKGIGGSDAAKICGLVPYPNATPYAVWREKTSEEAPADSQSEAAYFGTLFEAVVASEFEARSRDLFGVELVLRRSNYMYQSEDHPFMLANVDRVVVGHPYTGFEAKTASAYLADEWADDEVPDAYYAQCQHYMSVMGWRRMFIACLIGGQRFVAKEIPRNNEFIAGLVEKERFFWEEHCVKKIPPLMIPADDPTLWQPVQSSCDMLPGGAEALAWAEEVVSLKAEIKAREERKAELENNLKMLIGEHAGLIGLCTWKQNRPTAKTDWKGLALSLGATSEDIERHTEMKPGARVLRVKITEVA